jgi:Papain family cysteine protease
MYKEGIYQGPSNKETYSKSHSVLITGWGTDSKGVYYNGLNSYSSNWGLGGYVRFYANWSLFLGFYSIEL